jgi:hypothetical protein
MPDTASRLPQSAPDGLQSMPKWSRDEDGESVSSNMKDLSLQCGKIALSNKRAAAELAQGQSVKEGGRPNKLRSASMEDSSGRGPSLHSPPSSPAFTAGDKESTILLQPETRSISQEQLVNEVKGIYAGLVMVEKKCVEVPCPVALI